VTRPEELVTFDDVGGMDAVKQEVRDTVGLLLEHPDQADRYGIEWNGILLHGAPGVGKTFFAKAIAGEYRLNFIHVSTGDLVAGIQGQSAKNIDKAFETALDNLPCVLFFDEFDSVARRRSDTPDQESRRTVNQLLTSLEAHREQDGLVVMAATNDLEHLDEAVIRPGRFDRHIRVDLPDAAARRAILAAQLDDRPVADDIDLDDLVRRTEGMTPAAIEKVVDAAALAVFREAARTGRQLALDEGHLLTALESLGGQDRPMVEHWTWDSLVLPADTKAQLRQLQSIIEDPEAARRFGVDPPSGLLLAGPPGTGKTTVAKVIAAQARCSFYPVAGADVMSKWVGESEGNIRRLFERARQNRPSVIFIDEIDAIAARRGLAVVEDAAQSFGATYKGRRSCGLSTIGCTSFFPSKPLGCYGDGGALFSDDDALAQAAREIRVHGQSGRYHHTRLGVGGRMDTLQCAVVLAKLERFDWELQRRREIGARYGELLAGAHGVATLAVRPDRDCVWGQYTVLVERREAVQKALQADGIPTAVHYPKPLHRQPAYERYAPPQPCPHSEGIAARVMSLPMSADLGIDDQARVARQLRLAVEGARA
jgi:SpoVK/Ycf46/Vps4 family AAA+-type ATPase